MINVSVFFITDDEAVYEAQKAKEEKKNRPERSTRGL
jgi:hypothetical protein